MMSFDAAAMSKKRRIPEVGTAFTALAIDRPMGTAR
jgi:hypothetical protein